MVQKINLYQCMPCGCGQKIYSSNKINVPEKTSNNLNKKKRVIKKVGDETKKKLLLQTITCPQDSDFNCNFLFALPINFDISINYQDLSLQNPLNQAQVLDSFNFNLYAPNYLRFYYKNNDPTNFYDKEIASNTLCGQNLRIQLLDGDVKFFSLVKITDLLVPNVYDNDATILGKDNIRNQLFYFILNIEKSSIEYFKEKKTCNNNFVPWQAYFKNVSGIDVPQSENDFLLASTFEINQSFQSAIYDGEFVFPVDESISIFSIFKEMIITREKCVNPAIYNYITEPEPDDTVSFYKILNYCLGLLNTLFKFSESYLLDKDVGIPKELLEKYINEKRARYYYNQYFQTIISRNNYLGFNSNNVNTSNGDGTYKRIPGLNPNNTQFFT